MSQRTVRGVTVVDIAGKAVSTESRELKRYLDDLLATMPNDVAPLVVLNLERLAFLDSAGLGAVVVAQQRVAKRGGRLVLIRAVPHIQRIVTVARLSALLPIYADETAAITALLDGVPEDASSATRPFSTGRSA